MKKVFIGSSSQALEIAHRMQAILNGLGVKTTCWKDSEAFHLSENTIDDLLRAAKEHSAGLFIFNTDDQVVTMDGHSRYVPRDNVLIEAGIFSGILGKKSVAICKVSGAHVPTDFSGVTVLDYDLSDIQRLKDKLKIWLDGIRHYNPVKHENNLLMLDRKRIQDIHTIDDRLHISDGYYKSIRKIRILNFAGNLLINPEIGDSGHIEQMKDIKLNKDMEMIMRESTAALELILTKPTRYNLTDLETKVANQRAGSSTSAVYSAIYNVYKMLSDKSSVYYSAWNSLPARFCFYVMKVSIPFAIFNVEFLDKYREFNHVKIDLYSASLDNEDNRRSFVIWQKDDPANYSFFVNNFNSIKINPKLCEKPPVKNLREWSEYWCNAQRAWRTEL